MTYHVTTDADNDPTIWDTSESELFPRAILRRSDLPETARELWPVICDAVTGDRVHSVPLTAAAQERMRARLDALRNQDGGAA